MASKAFVLLGVLVVVFLVTSEEAHGGGKETKEKVGGHPDHYTDGRGRYNGPGGGYNSGGGGGWYNEDRRGRCPHGCCLRGPGFRVCRRCCAYAGEAVQTEPAETKP